MGGWEDHETQRRLGGGVKSEGAEAPTAVFFSEVGVLSAVIWRVAALSKGRGEKGMVARRRNCELLEGRTGLSPLFFIFSIWHIENHTQKTGQCT